MNSWLIGWSMDLMSPVWSSGSASPRRVVGATFSSIFTSLTIRLITFVNLISFMKRFALLIKILIDHCSLDCVSILFFTHNFFILIVVLLLLLQLLKVKEQMPPQLDFTLFQCAAELMRAAGHQKVSQLVSIICSDCVVFVVSGLCLKLIIVENAFSWLMRLKPWTPIHLPLKSIADRLERSVQELQHLPPVVQRWTPMKQKPFLKELRSMTWWRKPLDTSNKSLEANLMTLRNACCERCAERANSLICVVIVRIFVHFSISFVARAVFLCGKIRLVARFFVKFENKSPSSSRRSLCSSFVPRLPPSCERN
jgi:hypothetical protein